MARSIPKDDIASRSYVKHVLTPDPVSVYRLGVRSQEVNVSRTKNGETRMSQSPSGPRRLVILPLKNAALIHDMQVLVPNLEPGQHAFNGSDVYYEGRHLTALRVNDFPTGTQHLAMIYHDADDALSRVHWVKRGPQPGVACSDEDPRLVIVDGLLHVIYNSAKEQSRQIHVARVIVSTGDKDEVAFSLEHDKTLQFTQQTGDAIWEKDWSPFSYQNELHLIYRANPPLVLRVTQNQLRSKGDTVEPEHVCTSERTVKWGFGEMRGGTPAIYDAQLQRYVTFFHSVLPAAGRQNLAIYYVVGMYTFLPQPPFDIERITLGPLVGPTFYDGVTTVKGLRKSVISPQGLIDGGDTWHMMYGKNDVTLHVATWSKAALLKQTILCTDP